MNIIMIGMPGSGKGTQARIIARRKDLFYFEGGAFSRRLAKKDPKIAKIVKSGDLIPDKEMTALVTQFLERKLSSGKGIMFDGYPRSLEQYLDLSAWLSARGGQIDHVIYLKIDGKTAEKRLGSRRYDPKTGKVYNLVTDPPDKLVDKRRLQVRSDDHPKVIKRRLAEFEKHTVPIVSYLAKEGKLTVIDGGKPIEVVSKEIYSRLE